MTRTTEPTTKAERDKWKAQPILIDRTIIQRLLDDADDLDALLQKLTDLESRLEHVKKLRQEQINALQAVHHEYIVDFAGMLAHRGLQAEADLVMENTAPLLQRIATIVSGLVGDRDALRRRVAVLVSALEKLKHGDGCYCDASFASPGCHPRHSSECEFAMAALSASPPAPPDPNAAIMRRAVELAQAVDDFCGGLIGGANWTDHTGRVANMTRINDAARIAEMILRDAAALRAGAGGGA